MEDMTLGMVLDYIFEYIELNKTDEKSKSRKATQDDFDSF